MNGNNFNSMMNMTDNTMFATENSMAEITNNLEEYKENPGIYLDYENEIPGPICKNEDEIIKTIQKDYFSIEKVKKFKNKFFKYQDELSTERVVNFIEKLMEA